MRASGTFEVTAFVPTSVTSSVTTALAVGVTTMEKAFTGEIEGRSATTHGTDRAAEFFTIVPASGTNELAGIRGTGSMTVQADGTHRITVDYELDG
jgi:hypothetical protein